MPTVSQTQDNWQTRSVDNVHINPSILEGRFLNSSLYGPNDATPLERYAPVNTLAPFLVGSTVIPNRVVCEIGTWVASPTPDFYYQWMADGVDIPGANNYDFTTDETLDGVQLSCEVRADNGIGEDYAVSNSILLSLIEPIEIRDGDWAIVTGLQTKQNMTAFDDRTIILSGLGTDDRQDVMRSVSYYLSGIGAEDRQDVNAMPMLAITGLGQVDTLSVLERDSSIAVIGYDEGETLVDGIRQWLPLKNYNAEMGLEGWDVFGEATFEDHGSYVSETIDGDFTFHGGFDVHPEGANTPYTSLSQSVYLWDIWHTDIDAGTTHLEYEFLQGSLTSAGVLDSGNIKVEFYAADGTTLTGTNNGPGLFVGPRTVWFPRSHECPIPPNTRYVRLIAEFSWDPVNGDNHIDVWIDNIKPYIRKGNKPSGADYGPNMQYWRVRFTEARSWSGSALAELEFLNTLGGYDLATGGNVIFGSAGYGSLNGDAAFDGVLSNYWAGAENSISEGTSWVGYDFTSDVRPEGVNIIARPGSDALQTGAAFNVEASEDGINWIVWEEYDVDRVSRAWNAGEARQFGIQNGTMNYMFDNNAPTIGYHIHGSDNYDTKGCVYKCMARAEITHIKLGLMNQSHDFDWQVTKIIDLDNPPYYFGRVSEIVATGSSSHNDGGSPDDSTVWKEIDIGTHLVLEPGEYFLIEYWDKNIDSNPNTEADGGNDPTQGRLQYITDYQGETVETRRPWLRLIDGWQENRGTNGLHGVSEVCNGPYQTETGFNFAIDFKGNFY